MCMLLVEMRLVLFVIVLLMVLEFLVFVVIMLMVLFMFSDRL